MSLSMTNSAAGAKTPLVFTFYCGLPRGCGRNFAGRFPSSCPHCGNADTETIRDNEKVRS